MSSEFVPFTGTGRTLNSQIPPLGPPINHANTEQKVSIENKELQQVFNTGIIERIIPSDIDLLRIARGSAKTFSITEVYRSEDDRSYLINESIGDYNNKNIVAYIIYRIVMDSVGLSSHRSDYTMLYSVLTSSNIVSFIVNFYSYKEVTKKKLFGRTRKTFEEYNRKNVKFSIYPSNIGTDNINDIWNNLEKNLNLISGMTRD